MQYCKKTDNSKRIAIITVYKNINYGSKLQSYALQHILRTLGYSGENLDIQEKSGGTRRNKLLNIARNPSIFLRLKSRKRYKKRARLFKSYLKENICESDYTIQQVEELISKNEDPYSYYICGSDQIWAPNQFDESYFLSFVNFNEKKIAYAPSIGLPQIPPDLVDKYRDLISGIGFVSIREEDGADIIKEILGWDIPVVLDPTLLLTSNEWEKHMTKPDKKQPYILCYFLGSNKKHRKWVENLKKETGYKIIVLPFATGDFFWGDEQAFEVGPKEFIGLINNAEIVCTDSYHGMLFSISFNKEFYAFLRFKEDDMLNQNSRVLNFLESMKLKNRIVDLNAKDEYDDINWIGVNNFLDSARTGSINFLKEALKVEG